MTEARRVLLIDNDEEFRKAVSRALLARGYVVEEALDGLEGISKALQDPPDVAVVDLIMPKVGGSEVVSFFRQNPYLSSLPIILLSGVLVEQRSVVDALDVDVVMTKGPVGQTIQTLLPWLEQVGSATGRRKQVLLDDDFHERTQVSELLEIKRGLGLLLETVEAAILEFDARGRVVYANAQAEEFIGLDRIAMTGQDILSIFPKAGLAEFRTILSRFGSDRGPVSRGVTVVIEGRVIRAVLTSCWDRGAPQSIVATLFEAPPQGDSESRLVRLTQYLCHEMRSSLLIIEGYLRSMVGKGTEIPRAAQTEMLLFLARETARLLRLVADASEFDRAIRELPEVEMQPIDFMNVITDALSGVTALAASQGIKVSVEAPPALPKVWGNHDKLMQVLYNLLLNALKFTSRGGSVGIELQVGDGEIVTTVADTGQGMRPDELREILAQAEQPERFLPLKGRRIGLGLPIAFRIIRAHRGRFFAASRVGVGSRFSFVLPVRPGRPAGEADAS